VGGPGRRPSPVRLDATHLRRRCCRSSAKNGVPLTSASYVLASLQSKTAGLFIQGAVPNPGASSITIYFSKTAPAGTRVAWFVVN
jgi:hypothetical protein